ncbi:FRG domain-containing protein [Pedobacter frigiditerrae]|uniref:FRG domain-containing protein n=1 Tax=Pedobacter frigiditerrae TaxID=2530452 RepID=A0A4R0N609_9SPHI|nr:FRG domain-containing protein [Pedobacter frigiditerrae]TCC93694.1 FRG domain-containing protein [Pedobacter frigiditerrae]
MIKIKYVVKEYIKSVSEYIEHFDSLDMIYGSSEILFRGQSCDRPLIPKLGRIPIRAKSSIKEVEHSLITEFKRGILPLSEFKPDNPWDLLALAQHHGLPTRLLDWSSNALIGLWFAVCKPPKTDDKGKILDGVVWVFLPSKEDFISDEAVLPDPFKNTFTTKIFKSSMISRRIAAQAGIFTAHRIIVTDNRFIPLNTNSKYKKKLFPVYIKGQHFWTIRRELAQLGINHFSIFPDLDGFSKHLEWKYAKFTDEKY